MLAEVLETYTPEERYSMSTFLDGVESYFGSGTRDSISRDSFVYITELVLNEQHLYGSSRLGMIQHADTFRNIYISHIVSIDSPDDEQRLFVYGVDTYYWDSLYTHQRGSKVYEGTNHLGNILVTYTDKRLTECHADTIYRYVADVKSQTDYSAFHALLPDRQWYSGNDTSNYRFGGSNGQEKDDEIYGHGNSYSAEFWQYDPRLGRRWNVDPVYKHHLSNYSVLSCNPIYRIDPNGDSDDGYTIDENGNMERVDGTGGDKYDVLYKKAEYDKGNKSYDYEGTNNSGIRINDKTFIPNLKSPQPGLMQSDYSNDKVKYPVYYSAIKGHNSQSVFQFLADATSNQENTAEIEWGYIKLNNGTTAIGTIKAGSQSINWSEIPGFENHSNVAIDMHSHPGVSYDAFRISTTDKERASIIRKHNPNARFYVYMPELTMKNWNTVMKTKVGVQQINYEPNKIIDY